MKKQSNELHFNLGFLGGFVFMFVIVYIILLLLSKRILPYFEGATKVIHQQIVQEMLN